jgi:hypothetical protein
MADQKDHQAREEGITSGPLPPAPTTQIQSSPPVVTDAAPIPLPPVATPTVPIAAEKPPAGLERIDIVLTALLLIFTFLISSFAATNSDVWMHLASGRRIAQGEWTIGVDPFAFTTEATTSRPAVPWVQHSWLYDLLFYLLYNLVGGAGLVALKALAVTALTWCLLQIPGGKQVRFMSVIYVGLAVLTISPQLLFRPMIVSLLLFGITLLICYRAGALGGVPANPRLLWRLPLLFMLWANLDAWFIMGPLVLALLWAGAGLGALLGVPATFPAKTTGAVLGVGLLACVVNPHHVRVFQLPPELAYPLASVVPLPDFVGAGGRTLLHLRQVDPDSFPFPSPLSPRYWPNPTTRWANVAGLALLALSLISFVANASVTKKPGAPGMHPGRFLLWAVLAFLGLLQVRLVPWFALVAAPVTLLNVVDWKTWLTNIQVPNWRPALLGRALALLLFFVLLILAWPGMLHGGFHDSTRRVAWAMPVDPSHHGAALRLAELNKDGQGLRVFNLSPDLAHYCAWSAPGVKCFFDTRWSLFPDEAARVPRARKGLATDVAEAWQKTFVEHKVDYLALSNFVPNRDSEFVMQLWADETHWSHKYGDGRTIIFAWSGPDKKFSDEFRALIGHEAFGEVPEARRAPGVSPAWPQEEPPLLSQYLDGPKPLPLAAHEAGLWMRYHQLRGVSWQNPFLVTSRTAQLLEPAGLGSVSITLPSSLLAMNYFPSKKVYFGQYPNGNLFLKARDFGPPGAPLLMVRAARRAVAENPEHPRVYRTLWEAYKVLKDRQEDFWTNYQSRTRAEARIDSRRLIRQIQIMTAVKTYLDLRPEDAEIHEVMARLFLQMEPTPFLDLALQHLQETARHFDQYRPDASDPKKLEFFKLKKAELEKQVQSLDALVKKNRQEYELEAATKRGLEKFGLALDQNRGLALEAVEQLLKQKTDSLSPKEKLVRSVSLTHFLLLMGRANELTKELADAGPELAQFQVFHAAALGNYTALDRVLGDMEKRSSQGRQDALPQIVAFHAVFFPGPPQTLVDPMALVAGAYKYHNAVLTTIMQNLRPEAELRTVRGIMALEQGDTAAARQHLEGALQVAGPMLYFQDRALAVRYLELLREADKK